MENVIVENLNLITIAVSMAAIGILGVIILNGNPKSSTNRAFALLAGVTIFYAVANYFGSQTSAMTHPTLAIALLRLTIFAAVLHSFLIFHLFFIFPKETYVLPQWYKLFLLPWVTLIAFINLTPLVFERITTYSSSGYAIDVASGPLIPLFGLTVVGLVTASFVMGIFKIRRAEGVEKKQLGDLLVGAVITYSLLLLLNFILPTLYNNAQFVPYAPVFIIPFIGLTAYAIYRHQLLDVRVIATQAFVLFLLLLFLGRIFANTAFFGRVVDSIVFLATAAFGILLVRSVEREIKTREEMRDLAKRLAETNWQLAKTNEQLHIIDKRKSEFVSIVSHQLRSPLTAVKGYASMLLENSYGVLPENLKGPIEKIFISSERLAKMITEFLDISKIEQGTMTYNFTSVDIKKMLIDLIGEFTPAADKKTLTLDLDFAENESFFVTADEGKIRQIISNLIDNGLKYTQAGGVYVALRKDEVRGIILVQVRDTGIGLSQDDIHHLFGKFTRGAQGQKQNAEGSGLGLYVAKKMLEAHRGKIWVDSEGPGRGSSFTLELLAEDQP